MNKVTHTSILCWAIAHLNSEAHKEMEKQEKAKAMGATDIADMLQSKIDDYVETIGTLKTLYYIETGNAF